MRSPALRGPAALLVLLAALLVPRAWPQGAAPQLDISSQVDRSEITIGDRIRYEIKVVYPAEGRVELPSVLGNLGTFEVKDYQASEPKAADNLKIQTWRFDLSTYTVGQYLIPPQLVVYLPPGAAMPANPANPADPAALDTVKGPRPAVFHTQPIEIKVVRTSAETVKDIADIAPPAPVPSPVPWLAYALGGLVLLGLAVWLLRRRRRSPAAAAVKPVLPPYEEAMEGLAAVDAAALIRQNRARELAFALSGILRRYVSRRYEVDALESTTTEFLVLVPRLPVTSAQKQWLGRFCESADLVKFAGAGLLETEGADLVKGLKDFVHQTRPQPVEGQGKAAAAKPFGGRAAT